MKTIEWQQFFQEQKEVHRKNLFTVGELVNVAGTTPGALNVELSRLRHRGIIARYTRGVYGPTHGVSPEALVRYLDGKAYITGLFALHRHHHVTQEPSRITCFTNRRHDRCRERTTPAGRYEFVCVSKSVYAPPRDVMTAPEQALFDFVYLMRRRGAAPRSVVTFRDLRKLDRSLLSRMALRYPRTVRKQVSDILLKG
jgi:hypothetical protein